MSSTNLFFTEDLDLTDEQISITRRTYLDFADNYVTNFERTNGALERTRPYTLDPFLLHYRQNNLTHPILFAGCGSGRDLEYVNRQNIKTLGIDTSEAMINLAHKSGVNSPLSVGDLSSLTFEPEAFDGIFCETALSHIKKSELKNVVDSFYRLLKINGLALLGFRLGNGMVYGTDDATGGLRYNTTLTETEIQNLVDASKFKILETNISQHSISSRPPFYNIIIQKQ